MCAYDAGGLYDGRSMMASMVLGAEGAQIGENPHVLAL
jgi:NAD(P)H-dependent flavin oxidoreductase YrpB (nitropropane dioxygenase family)